MVVLSGFLPSRTAIYMGELTAKMINVSVKRVITTPMPIVIFASLLVFVAKSRTAPTRITKIPKGIPNDRGISSLLSTSGQAG